MKIVSVLRSGPEYRAEHAQRLHAQFGHLDSVCLTDLPSIEGVQSLPLSNVEWAGWWAKMDLFNPNSKIGGEDILYFDIDTEILGDVEKIADAVRGYRRAVMLSDFYHPQYSASGVMYIPAACKRRVWEYWNSNAYWFMVRHRRTGRVGDQGVIAEVLSNAHRWDHVIPGAILSYKKHIVGPDSQYWVPGVSVGDGSVPEGCSVICYHGKPRPWEIENANHRRCTPQPNPDGAEVAQGAACYAPSG